MTKPAFICKNKVQIMHSNHAADQRLVFHTQIVKSVYFLNFKCQVIFSGCTAQFVLEDRFSCDLAHIIKRHSKTTWLSHTESLSLTNI